MKQDKGTTGTRRLRRLLLPQVVGGKFSLRSCGKSFAGARTRAQVEMPPTLVWREGETNTMESNMVDGKHIQSQSLLRAFTNTSRRFDA